MWEIPIYGVLCGKYLFTNPICCLEERFVWEIPICKLDWSVSCGKFLFAISIGCICSSLASVSYREKLGTGSTTPSLFLTSGRKVQQSHRSGFGPVSGERLGEPQRSTETDRTKMVCPDIQCIRNTREMRSRTDPPAADLILRQEQVGGYRKTSSTQARANRRS